MSEKRKLRGSWVHRFFVFLLSVVFGVLVFWILGFLTSDIGSIKGPDYSKIEKEHIGDALITEETGLKDEIAELKRSKNNLQEQRTLLKDSTASLQNTVEQLLAIQKQSIEKGLDFPEDSRKTLANSQQMFLENQSKYQQINTQIGSITEALQTKDHLYDKLKKQIETRKRAAREEYNCLRNKHRLKVAAFKLAFLIPVFLVASWFFMKKRGTTYAPMVYAGFIAAFITITIVVHEYFPSKYFKYIAIIVVLGIVTKILTSLLKKIIAPKKDWLIKQYQESYDKFVCPVCTKPIKVGPLRYVLKQKKAFMAQQEQDEKQQPYTCPSCGTGLYGECSSCGKIRHLLLPYCEHCGQENPLE